MAQSKYSKQSHITTARQSVTSLTVSEIRRLLELVAEAGQHTQKLSPPLVRVYGTLLAELYYELWAREQAGHRARRDCGRPVSLECLPITEREH